MGIVDHKSELIRTNPINERESLLSQPFLRVEPYSLEELRRIFPTMIFGDPKMCAVLNSVVRASTSSSSVLILGESGTGKELIAKATHYLSSRRKNPFIAINCSAIPDNLLESELFGHEKGAFTGADRKRSGLFHIANRGSVFLDEIGDMPATLQAKLLRVLQEKKFTPIGARDAIEADVRIIAATNIDLIEAIRNNQFRVDLYYRINVFPVELPPLRERRMDIELLLNHFIEIITKEHPHFSPCWFDDELKEYLIAYDWPGNIRQLQNIVERLVFNHGGREIKLEDIPEEFFEHLDRSTPETGHNVTSKPKKSSAENKKISDRISELAEDLYENVSEVELTKEKFNLQEFVFNIENTLIKRALDLTDNNKNRAAKLLGLNRTTLVERIKKRSL